MSTASLLTGSGIADPSQQATPEVTGDMPLRTLVFSSQKGGSGKTTLCGQLAVQAGLAGMGPVALIDTGLSGKLAA